MEWLHYRPEWWQIVIAIFFALSTLDRLYALAEHLGFLPSRLLTWLQGRWLRRVEDVARQRALDSLLSNGITDKLNRTVEQGEATAELLAHHINEAQEDRRLASEDRRRLNALYEHLLGTDHTSHTSPGT